MMKKKLILPLIIFFITILTIVVGLFIKAFYINTPVGIKRVNELIYTFTAFSTSFIVTSLLDIIKKKISKIGHIILLTILLVINIYLGAIFVFTYYKYIDIIINKLVYLSTLNSLTELANDNINNTMTIILRVASVVLLLLSLLTIIVVFIKPVIKRIVITIHTAILDLKETKLILFVNLSKGFLYKPLP